MSNMDWLQTLLGGVSGAFTGASVANERRSREAELARQVARQAMLDERQAKLDTESAFDRGIQRESALGELGYERGTLPRTGPAMMALPGMGALDVGAVMDARIGPQMTTPDGASYTLNRFQTPRARAESAAQREQARAELLQRIADRKTAEERAFLFQRDAANNAARLSAAQLSADRTTRQAEARAQAAAQAKRGEMFRKTGEDVAAIDAALAEVSGNAGAFGMKNYLPGFVRRRLPWRDNTADAASIGSVEWVVGELRHGRFGGAITPTEAAKAARVFSDPTSPPEQIAAELGILRDRLANRQRSLNPARPGDAVPATAMPDDRPPFNPDEWDR